MNKKVVFLPYDMDTALGNNNEGALVYGYGLEDTDLIGGIEPVFNGQDSVLWCNLRDIVGPEIKTMYQTIRANSKFNYEAIEKAFEDHQSKWPEAVFNDDAYAKYIQPLVEENDKTYLPMLLGSKTEQRKWWLYNRLRYMDSKYNSGDALTDRILIRGNAKANITLTPYADIYVAIRWGSTTKQERATRNTSYTITCPLDSLGDTDIYIYSASQISDIGDLSGLYLSFADFHSAKKLVNLVVGSSAANYDNTLLRSLNVDNLELLKKLDVRNCSGLGTSNENYAAQKSVDMRGCIGIEEVYFDGTNIGGVQLPNGGLLKKLHLPGTITSLEILNQTHISEFVCPDFSNVTTLNLENSLSFEEIDDILDELEAGCRVRLYNYYWEFESISDVNTWLAKFTGMTGLDQNGNNLAKPMIYATIHVPTATGDQIDAINANFPDITIDADVATYNVHYYNWEGTTLIKTNSVAKGSNAPNETVPSHDPTAQYTFVAVGWNSSPNSSTADATILNNIQHNTTVYAAYTTNTRTYTVRWLNSNNAVLETQTLTYGATATYSGGNPSHPTDSTNFQFTGWSPTSTTVTGNVDYIAQYKDLRSPIVTYLKRSMTEYTSTTATEIGQYAFYNFTTLTSVETSAGTIGQYAFSGCSNLEIADFTKSSGAINFADSSLNAAGLKSLIIRSHDTVATLPQNPQNFLSSSFTTGESAIYVPSEMVASYKVSSDWSTYASHIFSIDDYPVTDFSTVSDSWSTIIAKAANGTHSSSYTIGDTKQVTYGDKSVYMQYAYDRPEGPVWVVKNFAETHRYNASMMAYDGSELDTYMNTTIYGLLPNELQSAIAEVSITYYNGPANETKSINRKVWALSSKEAGFTGTNCKEGSGYVFSGLFTSTNSTRIKYNANGASGNWWLRSSNSASYPAVVSSSGTFGNDMATSGRGVVFGFVLSGLST